MLTVDEIRSRLPHLNVEDLRGGLWVPGDGVADPLEICLALTHLAKEMGVHVVPQCEVKQVLVDPKRDAVRGVETDKGFVECDAFVNCAGIKARKVATLSKPRVQVSDTYYTIVSDCGVGD